MRIALADPYLSGQFQLSGESAVAPNRCGYAERARSGSASQGQPNGQRMQQLARQSLTVPAAPRSHARGTATRSVFERVLIGFR